jgi:hypothetical protein
MANFQKLFTDGITSLNNMLANRRNTQAQNQLTTTRVNYDELRAIYRMGMGSKIIRLKAGIALNNTIQFDSIDDEEYYKDKLQQHVKNAAKFQLAFGRSIVVIHDPGADLTQPLGNINDWTKVRYHTFSGDMVYVSKVDYDLSSPDYFKPKKYTVRGFTIHPSRVVDFKYVEPVEMDAPEYNFGGISEFELIRAELVNDQVIQRAVPAILEKSSTLFYKIKGFKDLLADKEESTLVSYFQSLEDLRSIYGAGIVDGEDTVEVHAQSLTNLSESDMITLRRLAMVTGLPMSWLVGEAASGLNSTGEGDRQVLKQTITSYQSDYLLDNINRLMSLHGRGKVSFKDGILETDLDRMTMQTKAIANALILWQMGEDHTRYLTEHNVITPDEFEDFFNDDEDDEPAKLPPESADLNAMLGIT